jgi:iron complex outermembrane recepter protein
VERIEVLRGPQGTLYGRNAMGGIINIITRQPSAKTEGFAEMSLGNYGLRRFTTGLRLPVIKNRLHAGAAVLYEELDGYYRNVFNNSKFDRQYRLGANYYLKYSGGTKWNAVLNIKHLANRNRGAFTLAGNKDEAFANPFMVNQNAIGRLVDNTFNGSLSLNHLGKRVVVSAQTAYQSNYRYYETPVDADFSPIDGVDIINNYGREWNNVKVLTQELKFSSAAPLKWVAGVFLFHQKIPNRQATHFGEDAAFVGAPDKNFAIVNTTKATNTGSSLFAQGTYAITQQLEVIAGLRYDYQRTRQSVLSEYQPDASPVPVFEIRPDTSARASYSALSPKLGLQFHQHQNTSLYLLYSRGYRTGGLTQLSADPSQPPLFAYKPEYSNNFELGSKNVLFSNRLRANIALFYTTITNAQVATLVLPDAITITKNTGSLTSKGVEAELAATLLKGLEAAYNLGYTQAKYTALKVAQNGGVTDLAGRRQVFTPELTSMLALQYGIDVSRAVKLVARGEWLYVGETYFDLANTIRQAPYHLLNARAGIALKHVELMFWARNLSDTKYIGYAYEFGAVHLADPKTYGLTLRAMF